MTLLRCTECGGTVSSRAASCPSCGFPMGQKNVAPAPYPPAPAPAPLGPQQPHSRPANVGAIIVVAIAVMVALTLGLVALVGIALVARPGSSNRCSQTSGCKGAGWCTPEGEKNCVAASNDDCRQALTCTQDGNCRVDRATGWCVK